MKKPLTLQQRREIADKARIGVSHSELARKYGIGQAEVSRIARGVRRSA